MRGNILATLVYYDILDMALSKEDIFRFLVKTGNDYGKPVFEEVAGDIDKLAAEGAIGYSGGLYFLPGRESLVRTRNERIKISARKWRQAKRFVAFLRLTPFIRAVFASGSLAMENSQEQGDLDVLVILKGGRIWLGRILVSAMMSLIGARRKNFEKVAPDKICLNHYITDKSLGIPFRSLFNAQSYLNLTPILINSPAIITDFCRENSWVREYVFAPEDIWLNRDDKKLLSTKSWLNWPARLTEKLLDSKFGDWLELLARNYQIRRIENNPAREISGGHVVYNDSQLAFHPDSPEQKILARYHDNLRQLGLA